MIPAPLRVVEFTNTTVRAGVEEHILTLLRRLDRSRFQLYLACPSVLADKLGSDIPSDVEIFRLDFLEPYQLSPAWRLGRWLRQRRIQILHAHLFYSSLCASPVAWLAGVGAVIETPHVSERWRHGWKKSFAVDRMVGWFVDAYIAVSQANARYLVEQKGLSARKIRVITNGIDPERFRGSRGGVGDLRRRFGFGEKDRLLVVIGRLEPQKGHAVLLRALADVRAEIPATRLLIVGEGSLRGALEEQCRSLGLEDAVRFVGRQSNISDWLALGEVVVLPSLYEGLPLVALEALAAGKPVIATAVDGTPEVVLDGETGLTVPAGDAGALAAAILRLLRDVPLGLNLAAAGRQLILREFTDSRQAADTEKLYEEVWRERQASPVWLPASSPRNQGRRRAEAP